MIPLLNSVSLLSQSYDVWFCDIWGVMHNGETAFQSSIDACHEFREKGGADGTGGRVILLTNAPRPDFSVAEQLEGFGVPASCYDGIVSSGDVSQHLIRSFEGKQFYHLGPSRDLPVIETAGLNPVPLEQADVILLTGLFDDETEGPEDYREMLTGAQKRELPMICANPDLQVERGARLVYCAGILGQLYEELGGEVLYAGKPYLPVYELAQKRLKELFPNQAYDQSRILCIGDGMKTDMPGALNAGFDALFVASGLHVGAEFDQALLDGLFEDFDAKPIGALRQFG